MHFANFKILEEFTDLQLSFAFPATPPNRKIVCDFSIGFRLFDFQSKKKETRKTILIFMCSFAYETAKHTHTLYVNKSNIKLKQSTTH